MKITLDIRIYLLLNYLLCLSSLAEESGFVGGGLGPATHFNPVESLSEGSEHIISFLEKPDGVYKLVQTSDPPQEVRKYTSETDYETIYSNFPGLQFGFNPSWNRLVDVYIDDEAEEVSILLSQTQKYIYLKSVKNYKTPLPGEFAIDDSVYLKQIWKPTLMIYFVPPELDPIDFSEKILDYNSAALTGIDAFELRGSVSDNNEKVDSYSFSVDGVKKNGIKFEESVLVWKRTFVSQLEFLNTVENLDDEALLAEKEDILASGVLEALSSFDEQPRAQAVKARIEALLSE